jgi:tetratricopeptide (TPR) repeat protein
MPQANTPFQREQRRTAFSAAQIRLAGECGCRDDGRWSNALKRQQKKAEADQKPNQGGARVAARPLSPPQVLSQGRKLLFGLVAVVVLPLVFLGLLEIGLQLAGYGYSTAFFKGIRIGNEEFLVDNDKFGLRFFPPELSRSPAPVRMSARKPPGTIRIFVFGESAALGDPRPAYSAGRYLQALLRERFPEGRFEVVCVAMTAINSHAILPIARECARQNGDLWIIYMGNNEMVGPFGAITIFGSQSLPVAYVRLILAMRQTRLGQLVLAFGRDHSSASKHGPAWGGLRMFMSNLIAPGDPRKEVVYQNFRRNLEDILRAGRAARVPILLNTVAVNLKDCAPFASLADTNLPAAERLSCDGLSREGAEADRQGNFTAAADRWAGAARLDAQSAELQFELGSCLLALTNFAVARQHLEQARDFDALPFRADSRINHAILETARDAKDRGVALWDAAKLFETNSPQTVPGDEWFYEHVHLNFDGNYQLARAWAEQLEKLLPGTATNRAAGGWAPQALCERRLGLTDWNRSAVLADVLRRLGEPPFVDQLNHTQQVASVRARWQELRRGETKEAAAPAREVYLAALNASPDDHRLHENFAEFLEETGALDEAAAEWRRVRELIPHHHVAWFQEGRLLKQRGKLAEAEQLLRQAVTLRPDLAEGWLELGMLHAIQGKTEQALSEYERERRLMPNDSRVYYHIGKALSKLHRRAAAIESLRRSLELQPTWATHYALGLELGFDGRVAEARKELEQVILLKPEYAPAHLNLGVALQQLGQVQDALTQFEATLRLEPDNKLAAQYLEALRAGKGDGKP